MIATTARFAALAVVSGLGYLTIQGPPAIPAQPTLPTQGEVVPAPPQEIEAQQASPVTVGHPEWDPFYTPPKGAVSRHNTRLVWCRVTACSPQDPRDSEYYARNGGYKGATYNVAADYSVFPKGTRIHVPGYMEQTYPGKFWTVDAPGGSVIRRSTSAGIPHVDVKFMHVGSAQKWGSQWLQVEVEDP